MPKPGQPGECPLADEWFYTTDSTTKVSPALWETYSCKHKQWIMANPVIGAQLAAIERWFEHQGLGASFRASMNLSLPHWKL